jgi:hypothetical protein
MCILYAAMIRLICHDLNLGPGFLGIARFESGCRKSLPCRVFANWITANGRATRFFAPKNAALVDFHEYGMILWRSRGWHRLSAGFALTSRQT